MSDKMKLSNFKVAYHRNGVSGNGFDAVLFDMEEDGEKHNMIGIVFDDPGNCAILDVALLSNGIVEFGQNSWRGDRFEGELRAAIENHRKG